MRLDAALLDGADERGARDEGRVMRPLWRRGRAGPLHVGLVIVQLAITCVAMSTPLFERRLTGSMALLLDSLGFDFSGSYTMVNLGLLSAEAGGWALLMSSTFWVFIVICPLLRGASLLLLLLRPMTVAAAQRLHARSRAVSYYYALEVMLVAVPLIGTTIEPMTATLFTPYNTPICKDITTAFPNPPGTDPPDLCFTISVVPSTGYFSVAAAVVVFLLSGFDGSPTHKYLHRLLHPGDEPPPYWPRCGAAR